MSKLTDLQDKIKNKIFDIVGSSATLERLASSSTNKWGDMTPTYSSPVTITVVPYNTITNDETFQAFGDLQSGETDMILSFDTSFSVKDKLTFDSVVYLIKQKEKFPFQNGNLAWAVRLSKVL